MFAEKALRDLEAWKRLRTLRTTGNIQRKMFPLCLNTHTHTHPASPSPSQLLTGSEFGTRELEKGQRWVREKHRWLSDGLALSDPDSPTQSLHLKGHFHETSKIYEFSAILTKCGEDGTLDIKSTIFFSNQTYSMINLDSCAIGFFFLGVF